VILDVENANAVSKAGYELVSAQDEKKSLCVSLRDNEAKPIGYISLNKGTEFTEFDITQVVNAAKEISCLLS
jgi:hypothetical protein